MPDHDNKLELIIIILLSNSNHQILVICEKEQSPRHHSPLTNINCQAIITMYDFATQKMLNKLFILFIHQELVIKHQS